VDRRRGERRQGGSPPGADRRVVGRRTSDQHPAQVPAFRLAHRGEGGFDVFEATGPESGKCPQCGAMVSVEMPRFAEPPARLELAVVHETIQPDRTRHVVELQTRSATRQRAADVTPLRPDPVGVGVIGPGVRSRANAKGSSDNAPAGAH
jgi:hypothetical protein